MIAITIEILSMYWKHIILGKEIFSTTQRIEYNNKLDSLQSYFTEMNNSWHRNLSDSSVKS